jgi:cardiolipin synthase A/B
MHGAPGPGRHGAAFLRTALHDRPRRLARRLLSMMAMRRHRRLLVATCGFAVLGVLFAAGSCQRVPRTESLPEVAASEPSFAATMEAQTASPVVGGNAIQVLLNGAEIFPAKLAAIRSARQSIAYAEYFYADGAPAREIAEALAERCRAGVVAHVLLDAFGTLGMPASHRQVMRDAGCRVVAFRPFWRFALFSHNKRNHRRILVVDGRVGVTGGSGVSDKWTGDGQIDGHWRDTDLRVEGPAVRWLEGAFMENWREATGEILGGERYFAPTVEGKGDQRAQIVRSSPALGDYAMHTMYLLAIASARQAIYLTNPYFLPDDEMERALLAAARRGVRIAALTPGKIDHNLVRSASRRGFGRLLQAGIEIYEYQAALLHSKTMVVDGAWATVGSTNFDNRSFGLNEELNVALYDRAVVRRLVSIFEQDLALATRVTYDSWRGRGLRARLFEIFVAPIQSQL